MSAYTAVALWFLFCAVAIYALAPYVRRMDERAEERRRIRDRDALIRQLNAMTAAEVAAFDQMDDTDRTTQ